jgi:hypothetical protein
MNQKKGWDLLIKSIERQTNINQPEPRGKKNESPEKDVEKSCLAWGGKNRCYFHVVESKAVYSHAAGRYTHGQAESGYSDLSGNNANGHSLWVELKAKGRRSNLSAEQYWFLKSKIEQGCFAVVVDSAEILNEFYYKWAGSKNKESYLISILPIPKSIRDMNSRPDPEGLGF